MTPHLLGSSSRKSRADTMLWVCGLAMQGRSWAWFCLFGSLLFLAGGVLNLLKVFKTQQMGGRGMEKLRGGAQERLAMEREGKVPLILERGGRRGARDPAAVVQVPPPPPQQHGSYKDALVSSAS